MPSEVINVGKLMRQEAWHKTGKTDKSKHQMKVQSQAIQEEIGFLEAIIESHMAMASELAFMNNRSTVMIEDIIHANGRVCDHAKGRQDDDDDE